MQQRAKDIARSHRPAWWSALYLATLSLTLLGCHTIVSNEAEWSRPVVVPVKAETLAGTTVLVKCKHGDDIDVEWGSRRRVKGCIHLTTIIGHMGAKVIRPPSPPKTPGEDAETNLPINNSVPAGSAKPDFQIVLTNHGHSRDLCGWTLAPFLLSFSLFPCVEDVVSRAEIQILDSAGNLRERRQLHVDVTNIYGVPALYYIGMKAVGRPEPSEVVVERRRRQFLDYLRSFIASYWTREQLARRTNLGAAS